MPPATPTLRKFRLRGCAHCGGDALLDPLEEEWGCLQCGRPCPLDPPAREPLPLVDAPRAA